MGWLHDKLDALNDNPLAIIAQVAGAIFGIPSYVTAGVVTAVQGGDIGDIAKSAALSYIATEALEVTGIGKQIGEFTKTLGADFTDTMMKDFNFKPDTMVAISKAATASMNSSIIGGINAVISGKNVMDGISSGFTSGLISSSTGSYFDSLNKDLGWGFSNKTLGLIKGATGSALTSLVTGKGDPAEAVGNYLFSAAVNFAKSEFSTQANKTHEKLTKNTEEAKKSQDSYFNFKSEYDAKVVFGESLGDEINEATTDREQKIANEFTPFKEEYESLVANRDAAIELFNSQKELYEKNKSDYINYDTRYVSYDVVNFGPEGGQDCNE